MHYLITALLAVALIWALIRIRATKQANRLLHQAIVQKQTLLREGLPGALGEDWDSLSNETNDLIEEVERLRTQRTGQLVQLEATLGSLKEAVLIVDHDNSVLLANKALQAIFPRATNILHHRLERVLHSVPFLNYVESVRKGEAQPQHEMEFAEDNRSIWVEVTGTLIPPLGPSNGPWVLFVLHDITKQKKLEVVRKEFIANVSHELRTPLSIIKGYIETLVDGGDTVPPVDRDRFLKTIQRHTERLSSLLDDVLTLSRLESINPGLRRESTSLVHLLTNILDDYRGRPAAAEHIVTGHIDVNLGNHLIDPLKVTQAIENLLDNALKYTPKGSHIDLQAKRSDGEVVIKVVDNGPGIPPEDVPHIFERFYRVDKGRGREKGGTGLGLSIVKHIVQLHGGRVSVESTLGQGTTFLLTLPARS